MASLSRIDPFLHFLICFAFLRHTLTLPLSKIRFMKSSREALLLAAGCNPELTSTVFSIIPPGDHVSNSPQGLIGVVADGQNHNQACFRSTERDVDQTGPFDR